MIFWANYYQGGGIMLHTSESAAKNSISAHQAYRKAIPVVLIDLYTAEAAQEIVDKARTQLTEITKCKFALPSK